jgi:TonB-dependent SusC/RagA subfamily outer membrane receptor
MRLILMLCCILLLLPVGLLYGQKEGKKIAITGRVTDTDSRPVNGAAIFIDKEKSGQVTNQNGFYKVKVNPGASEIIVFTLLYGSQKQLIGGRTSIDFILDGNSADKSNRAGADISRDPTMSDINEKMNDAGKTSGTLKMTKSAVPVYQDIYDMIRGRVPGVEVSGKSIKIRGANSLNVSTEPLFVVDGIIVNSIDHISPDNVQSIEVLKGPDATVYGTRGSNGVIVIRSKTGKE